VAALFHAGPSSPGSVAKVRGCAVPRKVNTRWYSS
jgi:hypothetical protein